MSVFPSRRPSLAPTSYKPTSDPSRRPSVLSLTATPSQLKQNSCFCEWATGCSTDSDCCTGGQICKHFNGYTQCMEDPTYQQLNNGCRKTNEYGCQSNADCCNPAQTCQQGLCKFGVCPPVQPTPSTKASSTPTQKPSLAVTNVSPSNQPTPSTKASTTPTQKPSLAVTNASPTNRPAMSVQSSFPSAASTVSTSTSPSATPSSAVTTATSVASTTPPSPPPPISFYMGSYDFTMISRWNYLSDRSIQFLDSSPSGLTPSWLTFSADNRFVYATNEYVSTVQAFFVNPSGSLTLINTVPSVGRSPCHLSVDPSNRFLLVANYFDGVMAVLPIDSSSGGLLPASQTVTDFPTESAHKHCVFIHQQFVTMTDKSLDIVSQYAWTSSGLKSSSPTATIHMPTGTGPRHIAFHPSGRFAVTVNELANSLTVIPADPSTGALLGIADFAAATVSTLVPGQDTSDMLAAELAISPNGRFVYASNRDVASPSRGRSTIVVFAVQYSSSAVASLRFLQSVSSKGDYPRYFQLVRNGTNLVVVNQIVNNFVSFLVDPGTGLINEASAVITNPSYPALDQPSFTLFRK
eukprot:CAMPEP_0170058040 /NCGR_PEP_ID=MMETSP0019_2-20121128/807_1 /TAXON_ID=98059 /ORGANISM="Dinobryon sp., Strain UTEXLB2267" /LENGTH=577 /DNA_ID=CAMNT_0010262871 /DNA_START=359 /DNA_END=2092 /DNA_ORIENTATION=-